jgi:hypothetical protein
MFPFTSTGVHLHRSVNIANWSICFQNLWGSRSQDYLFASSRWWSYISTPKNAQIYIYDTKNEFYHIKNIFGANGDDKEKITELDD